MQSLLEDHRKLVNSLTRVSDKYSFPALARLGREYWETIGGKDLSHISQQIWIRIGLLVLGLNTVYYGHSTLGDFYTGCPFMVEIDLFNNSINVYQGERCFGKRTLISFRNS